MARLVVHIVAGLALCAAIAAVATALAAERPPGVYTSHNLGVTIIPPAGFRLSEPYISGARRISIDANPVSGFPTNPSPRSLCTYTFVANVADEVHTVAEFERQLIRDFRTEVTLQFREEFTNPQGAPGLELMLKPLLLDVVILYNTAIEARRGRVELFCGLLQSEGSAAVRAVRYLVDAINVSAN